MSPAVSPEEIRAAAETYKELGPGYRDAVIESFLDNVGREIDARVDARVAGQAPPPARSPRGLAGSPMAVAIISMILGAPISAIAVAAGRHPAGLPGLIVVWIAIAVINVACSVAYRGRFGPPPDRR